ncbi:MAG: DUF3990 domain-containing protein [Kiritimatiellia bacterium]|nr:DUF3990 domain-containing protein [Kiritimatiellia bacterium]
MTVWHGGEAAVAVPDLTHSRKAVDFGAGFYVTPILRQAERWCEKRKRRTGTACLSRYEYDEAAAGRLKILTFDSYSEEWLDFIVDCRAEADVSDWDIVVGGVANDRVFDTLEAFFDGFASKEQTIDRLRLQSPNLQICLRTQAALSVLKFIGSEAR